MICYYCFIPKLGTLQIPLFSDTLLVTEIEILNVHLSVPNSCFWKQYCLFLGGRPINSDGKTISKRYLAQCSAIYHLIAQTDGKSFIEKYIENCIQYYLIEELNRRMISSNVRDLISIPLNNNDINKEILYFPIYAEKNTIIYSHLIAGAFAGNHLHIVYQLMTMYPSGKDDVGNNMTSSKKLYEMIYRSAVTFNCTSIIEHFFDNNLILHNDLISNIYFHIYDQSSLDLAMKYFIHSSRYNDDPLLIKYLFMYNYLISSRNVNNHYMLKFIHQYMLASPSDQSFQINSVDDYKANSVLKQIFENYYPQLLPEGHDLDPEYEQAIRTMFEYMLSPILANPPKLQEIFEYFFYSDFIDTQYDNTNICKALIKCFSKYLPIHQMNWNRYLKTGVLFCSDAHLRLYLKQGVTQILPIFHEILINSNNTNAFDFYSNTTRYLDRLFEYAINNNCHSTDQYLNYLQDNKEQLIQVDTMVLLIFVSRLIHYLGVKGYLDNRFDQILIDILTHHSWSFIGNHNYNQTDIDDAWSIFVDRYSTHLEFPIIVSYIREAHQEQNQDNQ
jgi:hypothetical protein